MRRSIALGLGVIMAAGVLASCTEEPTTGPNITPQFARPKDPGNGGGNNQCDPKKEVCELVGRMTGGGQQIAVGGATVSKGLTLHCDITLSNNLEINWGGNSWHLDKPIATANCVDDPSISPEPPPAPFDTFHGTAIGRLNGVDGYAIDFTFADAGEPGGANDMARILITAPDGSVVLNVPLQFTTNGNLQAHFDQPHK
jgi:hypothetical protein